MITTGNQRRVRVDYRADLPSETYPDVIEVFLEEGMVCLIMPKQIVRIPIDLVECVIEDISDDTSG